MIDSINSNLNSTIHNDLSTPDIRKSLQDIRSNRLGDLDIPLESDGATLNISSQSTSINQLSAGLEGENKALSATQTANRSLQFQRNIVSNIKEQLENSLDASPQDQNAIASNINDQINTFSQVSNGTVSGGKTLLKPTTPDETLYLETSNQQYSIKQSNGTKALDGLSKIQQNLIFDENNIMDNLNTLDNVDAQLAQLQGNFQQVQNVLIDNGKQTLSQANQESFENKLDSSNLKNVNFGKESSDFSKLNLTALQGSLIGSQANATLDNNIRLLV